MARPRGTLAAVPALEPDAPDPAPAPVKSANLADLPSTAVCVSARTPGFRRVGRAWPGDPGIVVQPPELTAAQWAAVLAEPLLTVRPSPLP